MKEGVFKHLDQVDISELTTCVQTSSETVEKPLEVVQVLRLVDVEVHGA